MEIKATRNTHKLNKNKAIFQEAVKFAENDINLKLMDQTTRVTSVCSEARGYVAGFKRAIELINSDPAVLNRLIDSCEGWE